MIDGRGREDSEPDRLEAGRFLQIQSRQCAIELDCLQKSEPAGGERSEALESLRRLGSSERGAQILAKIRAIGSQFIIGLRGEAPCSMGNDPIFCEFKMGELQDCVAPCFSRQERISGPAAS